MFHKLQYETIPSLLGLNHQPLKLYLALCQYADIETGECWPSQVRLGKECKITSGRDMKAAIKVLSDDGFIATWTEGSRRHFQVLI